ncbi:DddA-like double-stranded DNA deaminase toxin [Actinokineospora sp. 24-640]
MPHKAAAVPSSATHWRYSTWPWVNSNTSRTCQELRTLGIAPARGKLWAATHVEVKLTVRLRAAWTRHVTLALNNVPCSAGRWSCDVLLPQILKPGQAITIYWPGGKRTYHGKA